MESKGLIFLSSTKVGACLLGSVFWCFVSLFNITYHPLMIGGWICFWRKKRG